VRVAGPQAWSGRGVECEHVRRVSHPRGSPAPRSVDRRPSLALAQRHGSHGTFLTARFSRHPSAAPGSDALPGATASPTPPRVGAARFPQKPPHPPAASLRTETPGRPGNLTRATGGPMAPAPHRRPTRPRATRRCGVTQAAAWRRAAPTGALVLSPVGRRVGQPQLARLLGLRRALYEGQTEVHYLPSGRAARERRGARGKRKPHRQDARAARGGALAGASRLAVAHDRDREAVADVRGPAARKGEEIRQAGRAGGRGRTASAPASS
jgi:hypothetical protein